MIDTSISGTLMWVGVVEDRMDPLFLGRCRVRIVGYHNPNPVEMKTEHLPWAYPVQPITSAAISGVGQTALGPVEGTWVTGFFRDGDDCQEPVILGTLAGIPVRKPAKKLGFRDPEKTLSTRPTPGKAFPREDYLKESDLNRLARHQKISETIVGKKDKNIIKGVPTAFGGKWDQPKIPYNAKYPFNHVTESESGHVIEIDDTKDNERIHIYHRSGTYVEVDANGTMVRRIVGDGYEIFDRDGNIFIKGKANITVEGACNVYIKNDCNLQVDGNLKAHSHGNIELKAGKNLTLAAKEKVAIHGEEMNIDAKKKINIVGKTGLVMTGTIKTTISSPILEVALLKMNGMSITPVPPKPPVVVSPTTISSKSPKHPVLPALKVQTRTPDIPLQKIAPITEKDDIT